MLFTSAISVQSEHDENLKFFLLLRRSHIVINSNEKVSCLCYSARTARKPITYCTASAKILVNRSEKKFPTLSIPLLQPNLYVQTYQTQVLVIAIQLPHDKGISRSFYQTLKILPSYVGFLLTLNGKRVSFVYC